MIIYGRGSGKFAIQMQKIVEAINQLPYPNSHIICAPTMKDRVKKELERLNREDITVISNPEIQSHVMYIVGDQ